MSTAVLPTPTAAATTSQLLTENWLRNVFTSDLYVVHDRDGITVGGNPDLVPDIAVVPITQGADSHPVMVIEIADSTLAHDTGEKAGQYAAAGIRDYWVIDVIERRLHVFRDPQPDADAKYGFAYKRSGVLQPTALIAPLVAELHLIQVIDLLP
ncbi:MAG: Uma2 family endonuclease [Planctomycetia bacterium]|nr:Uma2 family endonuclease [Planctomycetia bacterium]